MRYLILFLIVICNPVFAKNQSPNSYAKELIAADAKDCGDVKYQKDATKTKTCIFEKLTNLENFYTWFWFKAGDTNPATGLAMVDGILYITWFDRIGKGKDTYFQYHMCDKWDFKPEAAKPIQCFMKKPKTTVHLFEMKEFVELKIN